MMIPHPAEITNRLNGTLGYRFIPLAPGGLAKVG